VTGTRFVLALGYLVVSWRRGFNLFFLFVFLVILHGLGLLTLNLDIRRMTGLVPILFVLIGLWLGALDTWFDERIPAGRWISGVLLTAAVAGSAFLNWNLYFGTFIRDPGVRRAYVTPNSRMAGILSRLEKDKPVIVFDRHSFTVGMRRSDFNWLIPQDLETYGARDWKEFLKTLEEIGPGREAVILIQGPGDLDAREGLLREILHCGPFERLEHPDNPAVEVRKKTVVVPADLPPEADFAAMAEIRESEAQKGEKRNR